MRMLPSFRAALPLIGFLLIVPSRRAFAQSSAPPLPPAAEEVIAKVSPSVVLILVGMGGEQPFALGSGVIVRPDGVVLTAYHLVKDAQEVQLRLKSGEVFDLVELLGYDERRDIAAVRVSGHGLPILPSVSPESAKAGETVYVVSHPGALSWTASAGILSALRLADNVPGAGSGYRLLQFTAPVSAGSSGGALVDAKGDVLGIVIGSANGQDLNFAVPVESVLGLTNAPQGKLYGSGSRLRLSEREATAALSAPATSRSTTSAASSAEHQRTVYRIFIVEKPGGAASGFPAEPLEKKLLENRDFQAMGFALVTDAASADILIKLERPTLSWDCTYRMTDQRNGTIIGSGKNIAWDCIRAAPAISNQIVKQLKQLYSPQTSPKP